MSRRSDLSTFRPLVYRRKNPELNEKLLEDIGHSLRLKSFSFDSSIELGFSDRYRWLDLHNCFDWQGFEYASEERRIKLIWKRAGEGIEPNLPAVVVLEFQRVTRFAACPRDPGLPYTEDSCLAFVSFTPPEFSEDFKSEFGGYRSDAGHLTFSFQSGFGLKIWAEEARLILPESSVLSSD